MILQSAACLLCAVASGYMLRRWRRLDDYDRGRIWKHYGLFCGLMCFGSCAGAVAYAAMYSFLDGFYQSFTTVSDATISYIEKYNYGAYARVRFPLNCVIFALGSTPWRLAEHT
jgi:hypothetical protein